MTPDFRFIELFVNFFFFFFKIFVGHMPICGATDTPVLDFWWRLLWVSKLEWGHMNEYE